MKDLTTQDYAKLLKEVKSFLSISWEDEDIDNSLKGYITSSIARLDDIAGVELDYIHNSKEDYEMQSNQYFSASMLAQDLLKNRVFYQNEKGLDDFEKNYRGELMSLYLLGKTIRCNDAY